MKQFLKIFFTLVVVTLVGVSKKSIAQGPYSYNSPDGPQLLYQSSSSQNNKSGYRLEPSQWARITDSNLKGIEITCPVRINLDGQMPVFTFYSGSRKLIEMFYRQNTLLVRRYKDATTYYDYQLLDPLFVETSGPWNVKLYITSSFFWVQSSLTTSSNYLTPIYFGLNEDTDIPMQQLLTNSTDAHIVIGTPLYQQLTLEGYVKVYAFNPTELMRNIQTNFSSSTSNKQKRINPADEDIYDINN